MNKKTIYYISGTALILALLVFLPVKITYTVYGTGKVYAINEWILGRTTDGRITSTIRNNRIGVITSYGGKEFQDKDVYSFYLDSAIGRRRYLKEGDKVGYLESNELSRQMITLQGELEVERALLKVSSTGEKEQAISEAKHSLDLAMERMDIQKKLYERKKTLYDDSLIAPQEYEIAFNDYQLAKKEVDLANSIVKKISTGEKPEQIAFIHQRIRLLEGQINNLKERLGQLTITAPFSGMLQHKRGGASIIEPVIEPLVSLLDTSGYIIIAPIKAKELMYVTEGQQVVAELFSGECELFGTVGHIDNGVQIVRGKQAAFITAIVDKSCKDVFPGTLAQTVIHTDELTPFQYLKRLVTGIFYR